MNVKERKTQHSATLFFYTGLLIQIQDELKMLEKKNGYYDINVMN